MTTIAEIGIRVDSSQAPQAAGNLDKLTQSAQRAQAAETSLSAAATAANTQLGASAASAARLAAEQGRAAAAMGAAALSAKQYSQALRQVPLQITDIVTGLASGQSPFIVAIQQGGQLKDSFGGILPAARALLGAITPLTAGVAAVAAAGALALKIFNDGQREAFDFAKSIILSGNAAGVTAGELADMATQIERVAGTRGEAAAALNAAVASGQIAGETLKDISAVAVALQHAAGIPIAETVKQFAALGDKPLSAAEALNKQFHFLTVESYEQIRLLDEQGRKSEAAAVAQRTFLDAERERAQKLHEALGTLPKLWDDIKVAAAGAWNEMASLGRVPSLQNQLATINRQLNSPALESNLGVTAPVDRTALLRQRADLERRIAQEQADARRKAQEQAALEVRRQQDELADVIAKGAVPNATATLQASLANIQRSLSASEAAFSAYEDVIEAQHRAGLISDAAYYDARRKRIEDDRAVQVNALKQENALLAQQQAAVRAAADRAAGRASPAKAYEIEADAAREVLELETKRKDNLVEIGVLTAKASAATAVLTQEERAGINAVASGYKSARDAAQAYLDTIQRRQQLELASVGLGNRARDRLSGRAEIEDRYNEQRRDLENARTTAQLEGRFNADAKKRYDEQLALIDEYQDKALRSYDEYYKDLTAKQNDWSVGAMEALHNYYDEAQNTAGQVAAALSNGLDSATDALVNFVRTGKLNFKDLVDSILADLLRIQLKKSIATILDSALGGVLGGVFGSGGGGASGSIGGSNIVAGENDWMKRIPKFATGTDNVPRDGLAYLHQGEAVIPRARNPYAGGSSSMGSGPNVTVNMTLNQAPGANVAQTLALLNQAKKEIKGEIMDDAYRGKGIWKRFQQ